MPDQPTPTTPTFDELYAKLEETTRRLEEGNLGLEASVSLYEEGADLVVKLRAVLVATELRIRKVQERMSDEPPAAVNDIDDGYDDSGDFGDVD